MARELSDDEATLLGALGPEKAAAHRRGERIDITAEEAGIFKHQANLLHEREFDQMKREIAAWRERFPTLEYRPMDDLVTLKLQA